MTVIEAVGQRDFVAGHGHLLARPALYNAADFDPATGVPFNGTTGYATGCIWQNYLGSAGKLLYENYGSQDSSIWLSVDSGLSNSDQYSPLSVRLVQSYDLTAFGSNFFNVTTLPAGSIIRELGIQVLATVVAGGTTVKLALGDHSGSPVLSSGYPLTSALTKNTKSVKLLNNVPLAADTAIDLCGVITDGSALGNSNISAGTVLVAVYAYLPANFPSVP